MDYSLSGIIATSIVFQASLAWNDVFRKVIENYFPFDKDGPTLRVKIYYAIAMTIIVLLLVDLISYLNEKFSSVKSTQTIKMDNGDTHVCKTYKKL